VAPMRSFSVAYAIVLRLLPKNALVLTGLASFRAYAT